MATFFMSFLGTSDYQTTIYSYEGRNAAPSPYIQEAVSEFFYNELSQPGSMIRVFTTPSASQRHWESSSGLFSRLRKNLPGTEITTSDIEPFDNELGLWRLFDALFESIPKKAELILDITHGYRTLPMLAMAVINYARTLKKIQVKAILYGAYEAEVEGKTPIIDMTRMDRLLRWGHAVDSFIRRGSAGELRLLTSEMTKPSVGCSHISKAAHLERQLASNLSDIELLLVTASGDLIVRGTPFCEALSRLYDLKSEPSHVKPFSPLQELVRERLTLFRNDSPGNLLVAIDLCIQFALVQQGLTLLQEGMITIVLYIIGINDYLERNNREAVARTFGHLNNPGMNKEDPANDNNYQAVAKAMYTAKISQDLADVYDRLRLARNNINHGGFSDQNFKPTKFRHILHECLKETIQILDENKSSINDRRLKNVIAELASNFNPEKTRSK